MIHGRVVQVDVVTVEEVGTDSGKAGGHRPAQTARPLPSAGGRRDVLVLNVRVHGDRSLEPLLAGGTLVRQCLPRLLLLGLLHRSRVCQLAVGRPHIASLLSQLLQQG